MFTNHKQFPDTCEKVRSSRRDFSRLFNAGIVHGLTLSGSFCSNSVLPFSLPLRLSNRTLL